MKMKTICFLAALLLSVSAYALDVDITTQQNVNLSWQHPTAYTDDSPLPAENLISTIIERNCDDIGWVTVSEVEAPANTYQDPTAAIGVGTCNYRGKTVAIGAVVSTQAESDYSSTIEVVLYSPKSPTPPMLMAE